eukprot:m.18648 g.18648  ORF g.18648 m.18648 type:complete len:2731 (+) comp9709_c0_seq1:109-8301(+)
MYRTTVLLAVAAIAFGQDGSGEDALDRSSMGGGGGGSSSTCGQTGQECNPCCSGNRPDSLTFRYTPGVSTISNNQEDKASISGTVPNSATATFTLGQAYTVGAGGTFTATAAAVGGRFDADSTFTFPGGFVNIHVSCSKALNAGDVFGPLTLVNFLTDNGATADASCSTPPCLENLANCPSGATCEACCINAPTCVSDPVDNIVPKDFCETCVAGALPSSVRTELNAWLAINGGMVCASNVQGGGIAYTADQTAVQIEAALCSDADHCPDIVVQFTCSETCPTTMPSFTAVAQTVINKHAKFQIGYNDISECPVVSSVPGNNVCGCDAGSQQEVDKPEFLELIYTGGASLGATALQEGKGGSSGAAVSCATANIRCYNNKATSETFFSGSVNLGASFVANVNQNTETECTVTCGGSVQVLDIHTSCSKALFTGQSFGALVVGNFPGQCTLPPAPPPPPCVLCCTALPVATFPDDREFPKLDLCGAGGALPPGTAALVNQHLAELTCTLPGSALCSASQRIQATAGGVIIGLWDSSMAASLENFVERMLCETLNGCTEVIFDVSCCDPCNEDTTPFANLDASALCVVDRMTLSIVDREDPVIIHAQDETRECVIGELAAIDVAFKAWRIAARCTDTQSPGEVWDRGDGFPLSNFVRLGPVAGDLFTDTGTLGPVTELVCSGPSGPPPDQAVFFKNITWRCTDECGNQVEKPVSFLVEDTRPPIITDVAVDATATCDDFDTAIATFISTRGGAQAQDCSDFTWTVDGGAGPVTTLADFDGSCPWTKTFTFIATDNCNLLSSTTTATFTATDTAVPTIACPATTGCDLQLECGDESGLNGWLTSNGGLTCNDDCGSVSWVTPVLTTTVPAPAGTPGCPLIRTYEFVCQDSCGNHATQLLSVATVDTQPPVVVAQPEDLTVECDGRNNIGDRALFERLWAPGQTGGRRWANDVCSPNPTCDPGPDYRASDFCQFCASTYDPVCGLTSGQTYPNSCYAYCNGCTSFSPGQCGGGPYVPPPPPTYGTPPTYAAPVTHAPATAAPATGAPVTHAPATGAPVWVPPPYGNPPSHPPSAMDPCMYCNNDNNPVCVGGDQQYENVCHAQCNGHYHFTVGTCYNVNNYGSLTCEQECGMWQGKVCGVNGITYNSPCAAACDNIYVYYAGVCTEQCGTNPLTYTFEILTSQSPFPGQCSVEPYEFTATDECGNSVSAGSNFVTTDNTPPVMTPAQDVTVDCSGTPTVFPNQDPRFMEWLQRQGGATANDLCAGFIPVPTALVVAPSPNTGWQVPVVVGTNQPAWAAAWVMNGPQGFCGTDSLTDKCVTVTFTVKDNCGLDGTVTGGPGAPGGPTTTVGTTARFLVVDRDPPTLTIVEITTDICLEDSNSLNKAIRWANCQNGPGPVGSTPPPACAFLGPQAVISASDSCEIPLVTTSFPGGSALNEMIPRPDGTNTLFNVRPPYVPTNWIGLAPTELPHDVFILLKQRGIRFDTGCPRVTILDITVSDAMSQGETRQAYHIYTDSIPPVFTVAPVDLTVECDTNSANNEVAFNNWLDTAGGGTCFDECTLFGPVATGIVGYRPTFPVIANACPLGVEVTFFCEDSCGNRIERSAKFKVVDTVAPTITVVPDTLTVECAPLRDLQRQHQRFVRDSETNAIISDDCCDDLDIHATVGPLTKSDGFPATCANAEGSSALTVQDKCGNFATKELSFFVRDTLAPVFTNGGIALEYPCLSQCTNGNAIARRIFELWVANTVNGCLEVDECQEDMSWAVISGMPNSAALDSLCGTSGAIEFAVTDACNNVNSTTVTFNFPEGPAPPPPVPPPPCNCNSFSDRDVNQMNLLVAGGASSLGAGLQEDKGGAVGTTIPTTCAAISIQCYNNKKNSEIFLAQTVVAAGTVVSLTNIDGENEVECVVSGCGGSQTIDIHTSCSKTLETGQPFGAIVIDEFPGKCGASNPPPPPAPEECPTDFLNDVDVCDCIPRPSPPPPPGPPLCVDRNRPDFLTMRYIGGSASNNIQGSKFDISGGSPSGPATITCQNGVGQTANIGDAFVVATQGAASTVCTISSNGITQSIDFHTSCSVPLRVGDIFGSLQVVCEGSCVNAAGGSGSLVGCPPPPSPPSPPPLIPCGCGGSGNNNVQKPVTLMSLQVVAGGITGSQQGGKGGSSGMAITDNCNTVNVECHDNKNPGVTYFGVSSLALGSTFTVNNQNGGNEVECTVSCPLTGAVQTIDIHVSCSQALFSGQNFGALTVVSFPGQCGSANPGFPPVSAPVYSPVGSPVYSPVGSPVYSPAGSPVWSPGPPPPVCNACQGVSDRAWSEDYYTDENPAAKSGGGSSKPKLSAVTVRYIEGFALSNMQEGKSSVSPQTAAVGPATVSCEGTTAQLSPGGELTFMVSGAESTCTVTSSGGTQTIEIHTSCSMSINVGDIYGSLAITRLVRTDGITISESQFCPVSGQPTPAPTGRPTNTPPTVRVTSPPYYPGPPPPSYAPPSPPSGCTYDSVCEALSNNPGRLTMLRFRFVSTNGGIWQHAQHYWSYGIFEPYSGPVSGQVRIKMNGVTWRVGDGQVFEIRASELGRNKLPNKMSILIGVGTTKARLRISTQCAVDLSVGDIFGVLEVVGYSTSRDTCSASSYRTLAAVQPVTAGTASAGSSGTGAAAVAAIAVGAVIVVVLVVGVYRVSNAPTGAAMMDKSTVSSESGARPADLAWDLSETHEPNSLRVGRLEKRDTQDMENAAIPRRSGRT